MGTGLAIVARACAKDGLLKKSCADRIISLLDRYSLPLYSEFSATELAKESIFDKKRSGSSISVIKIRDIGNCFTEEVSLDSVQEFFEKGSSLI